ncbi:MAG: DUF3299 domain-containing protein [Planctomycetota bacterium]
MKIFWALVAVAAVVTGVLLLPSGGRAPSASVDPADTAPVGVADAGIGLDTGGAAASAVGEDNAIPGAAPATPVAEASAGDLVIVESVPVAYRRINLDDGYVSADARPAAEPNEPIAAAGRGNAAVASTPGPPDTAVEAAPVELVGSGTQDDPYVVAWDTLLSAKATYQPREQKTSFPPQVEALDGKWVRLEGYALFPLANPQPRELLVMLNPWDGCCIGVPPSPYDAVEVTLARSVGDERFAQTGAVVGTLRVDPYLVGNWLVGLYTISEATFEVTG